ncbi:MAG: hypothetical protein ACI4XN_09350, partial [Candidatus Kurthia intestinigallinarum]
ACAPVSALNSAMVTFAPSFASAVANAKPNPYPAPVTIATLSANLPILKPPVNSNLFHISIHEMIEYTKG